MKIGDKVTIILGGELVITTSGEIVDVYQVDDPIRGNEPRKHFVVQYTNGKKVSGTYLDNEVFPC